MTETSIKVYKRFVDLESTDTKEDTLTVSFSSETPVERSFGTEILSHDPEAVDLSRFNNGAPVLWSHNPVEQIGVVKKAFIKNKKGYAEIRWGNSQRALEVKKDVLEGIVRNVSVGYTIEELDEDEKGRMIARKWSVMELSFTAIPADPTVGVNRTHPSYSSNKMTEKEMIEKGIIPDPSTIKTITPRRDPFFEGSLPLDKNEQQRYSLINMIRAVVENDFSNAGFERECSKAIEQQSGQRARGFYIPNNLQVRTPYITTTAASAGNLVGTVLDSGNFIDALRSQLKVIELGATVLTGNVGNLDVPRQSGLTSTYWVAEGSNITEASASFDKISLTPKTVGGLSSWTRIQELQATPDLEQLVRNDLTQQLAAAIDLACINGSGSSNQPRGILNVSGVNAVVGGTNGASVTFDHLLDLIAAVSQDNADAGRTGFLTNNQVLTKLLKIKDSDGNYLLAPGQMQAGAPATLWGRRCEISQQVPSNLTKGSASGTCSAVIYGNWSDLIIAQWGAPLDILVNPYGSSYAAGNVEVRAMSTLDLGLRHPESFAVMKDALT